MRAATPARTRVKRSGATVAGGERTPPETGTVGHGIATVPATPPQDAEHRAQAIEYAIQLLAGAVAQDRIAIAERGMFPDTSPVENMIYNELSFLPSVADLRRWDELATSPDLGERFERHRSRNANEQLPHAAAAPDEMRDFFELMKAQRAYSKLAQVIGLEPDSTKDDLNAVVEEKVRAVWSSIPEGWKKAREQAEYRGAETSMAGWRVAEPLVPAPDDPPYDPPGPLVFQSVTAVRAALTDLTPDEDFEKSRLKREVKAHEAGKERLTDRELANRKKRIAELTKRFRTWGSRVTVLKLAKKAGLAGNSARTKQKK